MYSKCSYKLCFGLSLLTMGFLFTTQTVFGQTEKLGIVQYTPPKGMNKLPKENLVVFSELNQTTGAYCVITLYGATPGTGNPQGDFKREWNNLVVKAMKAEANPKTDTQTGDGWTAISGGSEVESEVGKAVGFLSVISGFGKTVSVLAVFNDPACVKQVDTFIGAIEMDKVALPANNTAAAAPPTLDQWGNLFIPPPTRQLTIADLVGNWGDNPGRISTHYVNRSDGSHAGTDSLHFTSKWTIDGDGRYVNDFFEVRNGKKLHDITTGTITIVGQVITIKHKGAAKYVVRGWLELPDMTILKVAGPWFDDQEIPERTFTDPPDSYMLTSKWVRVEKSKKGVKVSGKTDKGADVTLEAEMLLVAVGRMPSIENLGLENTKVIVNPRGTIKVNDYCETDEPDVYAIGDVIDTAWLAHLAAKEGIMVVEKIVGKKVEPINLRLVPN